MHAVSAVHTSLSCDQVLVSAKDQMIRASVCSHPDHTPCLWTTTTNGLVSWWRQFGYNRGLICPLPLNPVCFMELSKGLQFSTKWFTAAWHALKFLSVFLLTSVDCLRRGGILEGWRSARGLVAMVTNPWAGFHLTGRKLNYLQTEKNKLM